MQPIRFKPNIDKLFFIIFIPTLIIVFGCCIVPSFFAPGTFIITIPVSLFTLYFLITPLFGYVELRDEGVFIKYGFFMKRFIPYAKIRSLEKTRKFYSESMMSLKNSFEHVNIRYNSFDVTSVSVNNNDEFIEKLKELKAERQHRAT